MSGSKRESSSNLPATSKVCGKARDYALYFRATEGHAFEQGLFFWVMCPTVGLNSSERQKHCMSAAEIVLEKVSDRRIEYVDRGTVGFIVNEGYFERGCTWKDLTFAPASLKRAATKAFGLVLEPDEMADKLIQIGSFEENSLVFSNRAGPASKSVSVNIEHLLANGMRGLQPPSI